MLSIGDYVEVKNRRGYIISIDIEDNPILEYPNKYKVCFVEDSNGDRDSIKIEKDEFFKGEITLIKKCDEREIDYLLDDFYDRCLG